MNKIEMIKSREESVYAYYLPQLEIGEMISSPIRDDDDTPSFCLYEDDGQIKWKDFGITQCGNDSIAYVQHKYDLDFNEAGQKIFEDVILGQGKPVKLNRRRPRSSRAGVLVRKYMYDWELSYWAERGIEQQDLWDADIWACDGVYLYDRLIWKTKEGDPVFTYLFDADNNSWKCYRPNAEKPRFLGWNLSGVIEQYNQLPETGETLIITKATKDAVVLKKLGYNACAPTGENALGEIFSKIPELNLRFSHIYSIFDNDSAGHRGMEALKQHGVEPIYLDYPDTTKDPDEVAKRHGLSFLKNLIDAVCV